MKYQYTKRVIFGTIKCVSNQTLRIAKKYFSLSNKHNLVEVEKLFTDSTIYISANTGSFSGKQEIMKMMSGFFASFRELRWVIHSEEQIDENTVTFDFSMVGIKKDKEKIIKEGRESIVVTNGKISRIEIQNK
jgi:hypothetical protein